MGFSEATHSVLRQYATFSGRARRAEYWYFQLFGIIYVFVAILVAGSALAEFTLTRQISIAGISLLLIVVLVTLALFLPGLAVTVRRLHDTNRSGWSIFISIIPFVGAIFLLVWECTRGTNGPNRFGPDPLAKSDSIVRAVR